MSINVSYTTPNGDYYQGMTSKEAEDKGIYKKRIGIDFYDIDKNHDGVLSQSEIHDACSKQNNRDMFVGIGQMLGGMCGFAAGALLEIPSLGTSTAIMATGAGVIIDGFSRMCEAFTPTGSTGLRGAIKQDIKESVNDEK